jgi:YHS domain-containing protein
MIAIDPVCKMEVETENAEWTSEYKGTKYFFCAPGCKRSFDADPEAYLAADAGGEHAGGEHAGHDHGGHEHHGHEV